jgi:cell division transport system permease protein
MNGFHNNLIYSIKQGILSIRRNSRFSLASIGTMMASLFLFGIFYCVVTNFNYIVKNAETNVGITVFFDEGLSQTKIDNIGKKISARKEVKSCTFVSAEEAWEEFRTEVFDGDVSDTFGEDNPLENSSSYEVYLADVTKQKKLVSYISGLEGVRQVNSSESIADGLTSFNKLLSYVSAAIMLILIGVSIFLISTTVNMGISVRKEEIAIMKLIGATDFFIRAPFIVEGMVIGLFGSVLPLGIVFIMYKRVVTYIISRFTVLSDYLVFMDTKEIFEVLIPLSMLIGLGVGFAGSFFTVKKHLKV